MKKTILSALALVFLASLAFAQVERKDLKVVRDVRKEAKKYSKDGWMVPPGMLPMEKALDKSYSMQLETDEQGNPKWIFASGDATAETQSAAKQQAIEFAKLELGGQLENEIRGIVENSIGNQQLSEEEAASVTKSITGSKNIISASLKNVQPVFQIYKTEGKLAKFKCFLFFNRQQTLDDAKKQVRKKLETEIDGIHDKLDAMLDLK